MLPSREAELRRADEDIEQRLERPNPGLALLCVHPAVRTRIASVPDNDALCQVQNRAKNGPALKGTGVQMSQAYDTDDCKLFAKALDQAWEIFLKTGPLTSRNVDVAKAALTYALLEVAEKGERNSRRLAVAAVGRMAKYEGKLRYARSFGIGGSRESA